MLLLDFRVGYSRFITIDNLKIYTQHRYKLTKSSIPSVDMKIYIVQWLYKYNPDKSSNNHHFHMTNSACIRNLQEIHVRVCWRALSQGPNPISCPTTRLAEKLGIKGASRPITNLCVRIEILWCDCVNSVSYSTKKLFKGLCCWLSCPIRCY